MARPVDPPRSGERIAKLLARAGVASRREIERMIAEGRVAVNGVPTDTPATLLPSLAGVTVDGESVAAPAPARLFLHHKPVGLLVTERDPAGRPTIYDRLPADLPRVVPVGRLDLNTEGLLLLTTDGGLKRELELPATGVERAYRARAYGTVTQAQLEALIDGVEIEGVRYGPIDANLERRTGANVWIELILTEGKNREVRRVLEHLGLRVSRLIRTRYGPFVLGDLPVGGVGEVEVADLIEFRRTLKKTTPRTPPGEGRRSSQASAGGAIRVTPRAHPRPSSGIRPAPAPPGREKRPARATGGKGEDDQRVARPARPPAAPGRGPAPERTRERATTQPARAQAERPRTSQKLETAEPTPPRPAKLVRKAGWARPKPKSGPARPRKPRG